MQSRTRDPKLSQKEKQHRKHRVLAHGTPSITNGIADAVVIKNENVFFLSKPDGSVPLGGGHGFGLYYHDCRYLQGYEFDLAGSKLNTLVVDPSSGVSAYYEFTNSEVQVGEGEHIHRDQIGITWERVLDGPAHILYEVIDLQNYGLQEIRFPFRLTFEATFDDTFAVRGLLPEHPGELDTPSWTKDVLFFSYQGADGLYRSLALHFAPAPSKTDRTTAHFELDLKGRGHKRILVSAVITESIMERAVHPKTKQRPRLKHIEQVVKRPPQRLAGEMMQVDSNSLFLNALVSRSLGDLDMLKSGIADQEFFAAGLPWFATLFGRDSIITALQTLAFNPVIAAQTLRVLAHYQAQALDDWRDAQPGKIPHELRVGELARLSEIPQTPYYGTVDATPLFLILVARHAAWTGDLSLFHELRENIERALAWIDQYGDSDGDGYVDYVSATDDGLINQGWKDSGDAIVNADASLAEPPIALVEVQGYVYFAKFALAALYERAGDAKRAKKLRRQSQNLRAKFNRDFWLGDLGFYALCLQKGGKPAAVVSSNPGQAMWSGIVAERKAKQTVAHLMADDLFSGWGIRTLSARERHYNPLGYHLGTVWPHDNALIVSGLRRYGFDDAARRLTEALLDAAIRFDLYRLPELFAGIERGAYSVPVRYPVACHPQAWAAGTIPFLVEVLLGLEPKAFDQRLCIVRPMLPQFVNRLELRRLHVGNAYADLAFERTSGNTIAVNVLNVQGNLRIEIEPSEPRSNR